MMNLYEVNTIHYTPGWNKPPPPKFSVGDLVSTTVGNGIVKDVIVAPASGGRVREHAYCVHINQERENIWAEPELSLVNDQGEAQPPD